DCVAEHERGGAAEQSPLPVPPRTRVRAERRERPRTKVSREGAARGELRRGRRRTSRAGLAQELTSSTRVGTPRVLQVALSLNPGGTERLVVELAARLHRELPTMICCLDEPGSWAREVEARGIQVRALGRTPGFRPQLSFALAHVASEHRADVIHAHHYSPFVYSCLALLRRPSVRLVFTEHGRLSDTPPSSKRK